MKQQVEIDKIYIDSEIHDDALVARILKKCPGIPSEVIADPAPFLLRMKTLPFHTAKKNLWLTRFKGSFLKPCPGTDRTYLCCNYWVMNLQSNCPLECTYCILQSYLDQPLLTVYVNYHEVLDELGDLAKQYPNRLIRVGTGELADSLALDLLTDLNQELIRRMLGKKIIFELKTKTALISHLPDIPKSNVVISWSINPTGVIKHEEFKTASLEERLSAARLAVSKGYRLGFHFDPILEIPDWEEQYLGLIDKLTQSVPEEEVIWMSMGSLRYPPELGKVMADRFPKSYNRSAELVRGEDGKMRYFRPLRKALFSRIYGWIRERWPRVFIYFCMENADLWQDVMGFMPENNDHLDFLFHESISRRFPDLCLRPPDRNDYGMTPAGKVYETL